MLLVNHRCWLTKALTYFGKINFSNSEILLLIRARNYHLKAIEKQK